VLYPTFATLLGDNLKSNKLWGPSYALYSVYVVEGGYIKTLV
jgi:hypothetical protein